MASSEAPVKTEDMPSFEESKNVNDDVRGTYSIQCHILLHC